MPDREKVIKGLKAHGYTGCKYCPYWGTGHCGKSECRQLARDALMLLEAQQPRVMTLEEVLGGDECWLESRNDICGYGDAVLIRDGEFVDFYRPRNINTFDFYGYGSSWRCWTSRPTDEQRKAKKWDT